MANVDEMLLGKEEFAGPAQEKLAEKVLRQKKRKQKNERFDWGPESKFDRGQSEAGQLQEAKRKAREDKKKKEKKEGESEITSRLGRFGTSKLLRGAWRILPTVIFFLPALAYINIHVFLRWILGENLFCKLGDEWLPRQVREAAQEAGQIAGRGIGLVEAGLLILLDIVVGGIILTLLAFIVMIVTWMGKWEDASWIGKGWMALKAVWELGWDGVKALRDLF